MPLFYSFPHTIHFFLPGRTFVGS
ncbi:MAG: hypothetical protein JWQ54_3455, partial [Mucilaginibacter sp.]|nr:hypothetical protein [Mucilaginibacter sp.]MDB4921472.1 hypothetical protein [Mucilaginibacter sp.]